LCQSWRFALTIGFPEKPIFAVIKFDIGLFQRAKSAIIYVYQMARVARPHFNGAGRLQQHLLNEVNNVPLPFEPADGMAKPPGGRKGKQLPFKPNPTIGGSFS
jgi:hypothetical protein